jgi:hypothetical protein
METTRRKLISLIVKHGESWLPEHRRHCETCHKIIRLRIDLNYWAPLGERNYRALVIDAAEVI